MAGKSELHGHAGDCACEHVAEGRLGKINTTETAVVTIAVYGRKYEVY